MFLPPIGPPLMLHIINAIEAEAWAGIAGLLGGIGCAIAAVLKGRRKGPVEVGHGAPGEDRTEYVLAEMRAANVRLGEIEGRVSEIDRRTEDILVDTRILRDRRA